VWAHKSPKQALILLWKHQVKLAQSSDGQIVREFKSKAHISFKHPLSVSPPKTKSLEPTTVMAWPQRPTGLGPLTTTRVHTCDTGEQETLVSESQSRYQRIQRAEAEQIKRIIIGSFWLALVIEFRDSAPNQKDAVDEHGGWSETRAGSLSTGLQEGCGVIPR
jgi:hypothetical protein